MPLNVWPTWTAELSNRCPGDCVGATGHNARERAGLRLGTAGRTVAERLPTILRALEPIAADSEKEPPPSTLLVRVAARGDAIQDD